jgi:hypothetical protein
MMYCVDIRDYYWGTTIETILETENADEAYEVARKWNEEHGVTNEDIESFYNEEFLIHEDGHACNKIADVYQDETR